MAWICRYCSTNNDDSDTKCIICDQDRSEVECVLTKEIAKELNLEGDVIIPMEFNVIGEGAFLGNCKIKTVTLHREMKRVMKDAFAECFELQGVVCQGTVDELCAGAFRDCYTLKKSQRPSAKTVAADTFSQTDSGRTKKAEYDASKTRASVSSASLSTHSPSGAASTRSTSPYSLSSGLSSSYLYDIDRDRRRLILILSIGIPALLVAMFVTLGIVLEWPAWQYILGCALVCALACAEALLYINECDRLPFLLIDGIGALLISVLFIIFGKDILYLAIIMGVALTVSSVINTVYSLNDAEDFFAVIHMILLGIGVAVALTGIAFITPWLVSQWIIGITVVTGFAFVQVLLYLADYGLLPVVLLQSGITVVSLVLLIIFNGEILVLSSIITGALLIGSVVGVAYCLNDYEEGYGFVHLIVAAADLIILTSCLCMLFPWGISQWIVGVAAVIILGTVQITVAGFEIDYVYAPTFVINIVASVIIMILLPIFVSDIVTVTSLINVGIIGTSVLGAIMSYSDYEEGYGVGNIAVGSINLVMLILGLVFI